MATQNSDLLVNIRGKDELSPELQKFESKIIRTVGFISAALAGIRIGIAPIKAASDFEREMANVAKTTDFASEAFKGGVGELDLLGRALLKMSLTVDIAATDLAKIAAAAGQQGLGRFGVQGIVQFTDSVSRMASVLDITAEQAANDVGKIVNIFRIPLADIERAVSTFNEVSNKSTASGEELLDVVKRIGDAAGSLELGQSVAIAATALDFGTSPEVAGTAFARVFSAMTEKADEFGKLMGVSATQWITTLQTNGVEAFRDFLKQLRKLDEQSQQAAIVKLVGGGRIGALLNKFVQDTTDSVLLRNLEASAEGQKGISALKEQAAVLNTLDAQVKILGNSFTKLGIEASQALLGPLSQYAAQLSLALQDPGVKSFVSAAVKSIGGLVTFLVDAGKAAANFGVKFDEAGNAIKGTGVNFENFLKVIEVFVALKAAEVVGGLISRISILGVSLKSLSKNANDAAKASTALGAANAAASAQSKSSFATSLTDFAAQRLGLTELLNLTRQRTAAVLELAAAEKTANAARLDAAAKQKQADIAGAASRSATTGLQSASGAVAGQREALRQTEARAIAAQQAQQAALAARVQQAEQETANRRLQIEADYQAKRKAIQATGTETGLKAARAERTQRLAEEQTAHERSLRGIQQYYARRAATQNAALTAEIQRERAALMQQFAIFDGLAAEQATRQAAATAAAAGATAAANQAAAATTRLTAMAAAAATARAALVNLGVALRALGSVLLAVGRFAAGAFLWVTIIYSIADALGLVEKAAPVLQKITDFLGLTSKAQRDKNIADEEAIRIAKELRGEIEAQTQAYRDNIDAKTGAQNLENVRATVQAAATTEDPAKQQKNIADLGQILRGGSLLAAGEGNKLTEEARNAIAEQEKLIDEAFLRIQRVQAEAQRAIKSVFNQEDSQKLAAAYQKEVDKLQAKIDEAAGKIEKFRAQIRNTSVDAGAARRDLKTVGEEVAAMFTPQSLVGLKDFVVPILEAQAQVKKLTADLQDAQQKAKAETGNSRDAVAEQQADLSIANKKVTDAQKALRDYVAEAIKLNKEGKISDDVLKSYQSLFVFASGLNAEQVKAFIEALNQVDPAKLTGAKAPIAPSATSGTGNFTSSKEESAARKLARARLLLARAEIQAENALQDEKFKQQLEAEQRFFDRGLKSISDFYSQRKRIQTSALDNDIRDKQKELEAIDFEIRGASDAAEKTRFQTDKVRVLGQIAVLREQRNAIIDENDELQRRAIQEFNDRALSERNTLLTDGIIPADSAMIFEGTLEELLARYRDFLSKLRSEGQGKLADAIIQGFNFEAFRNAIKPASDAIDLLIGDLDRLRSGLALSRQDGAITSVQEQQAFTEEVRKQIPLLQDKLAIMEVELQRLAQTAGTGSTAYAQQAAAIDNVRLRLRELAAQTDLIARQVNQDLAGSLASALDKLTQYGSSLRDVINGLLLEVANNIKKIFLQDISERIVRAVGSTGTGGLGGLIQGALQSGQSGKVMLGATPASPVWVRDVNQPLPNVPGATPAAGTGEQGFFQAIVTKIGNFFTSAFDSVKSFLGIGQVATDAVKATTDATSAGSAAANTGAVAANTTAFGALTTVLSTVPAVVTGAFGAVELATTPAAIGLTGVASTADVAIAALVALATAADVAAVKSVVAHTGGIVGKTNLSNRKVSPFVFAGARRMHGGGVAGLKTNEVPAILKKGEAVLTENQQSLVAASMNSGKGETAIRNVLVTDPNFVPDAMATSQGEKVLWTFLTRNRAGIRQVLG